ncbi:MAG: PilZ domain-containing protein [Candidatus Omnitrophica bacterium]|nr:PilZ domain-containing protein [Candidatus Omnitrophota bacterium]MBU4589940.1 PilZ domain-containing protein [Candidatus Omnitrophota bacterium]
MKEDKANPQAERRSYIRLDAVFPVEFQFLDPQTGGSISDIKQGFTRDIGKGGICLEVNHVEEGFEHFLKEANARLDLRLHIPLSYKDTKAVADIAWYKKAKSGYPNKYLIGLSFLQIDPKERNRIYSHARLKKYAPRIVAIFIISLMLGVGYFYSSQLRLALENKRLVEELVQLSGKKSRLEKDIMGFDSERVEKEAKLLENREKLKEYEGKLTELERLESQLREKEELLEYFQQDRIDTKNKLKEALGERTRLSKETTALSKETEYLKERIEKLSKSRVSAEQGLKDLLFSFEAVEEKSISSMYRWIKNHQNDLTGLIVSYEGDNDLKDWAFTYDQSLATQCFNLMGDQANAQKVLDFYRDKAKKKDGGFCNAYDAYTGLVLEYNVHAGPNIWLGIAAIQYAHKFKDEQYLLMAEDIASWLIGLQGEDKDFGIKGGPKFKWFSTEHNLDAYAFFGMLYEVTDEEKYLEAQRQTLQWIKKYAFNRREGRLNRGKGDATIATDTFAWAVAAMGPALLKRSGMDPDQIIDFAETNCLVTTKYARPGGEELEVTGFDFGKYEHLARGGIVSTEWTAQMVVTLKIMADYHQEMNEFLKEDYYKRKAGFYLSELEKMVIISPSRIGQGEGCLPYASQDDVDTGHGWRAPRGSRTGSAAGTAYTIFARHNYNPLTLR